MPENDVIPKSIIHLDMDAFYASVEVLDNPDLSGLPVIVGGTSMRGVVSAASYEARKFGVHSAMPIATAKRLCPQGIYLPVRMSRYMEVSGRIFDIFRQYTPLVEPLSLDEAFLDVTGSIRLFGPAEKIAERIRIQVKKEIGLTVSAGVAPTKFVAKIASDMDKPDGLTIVPPDKVGEFLFPLPIKKLWGVGKVTQKTMQLLGVETFGDLSGIPEEVLEKKFGVHGRHLHLLTLGVDEREVSPSRGVKSMGAEETMMTDIHNPEAAARELLRLAVKVTRRMRAKGFLGRTVTLKVKYSDFKQVTRSESLASPTDEARIVYQAALRLMESTAVGRRPVRLLGISLSKLEPEGVEKQQKLWEESDETQEKRRDLDRAMDKIADRFGDDAIIPATLIKK